MIDKAKQSLQKIYSHISCLLNLKKKIVKFKFDELSLMFKSTEKPI